jgi:predicted porin
MKSVFAAAGLAVGSLVFAGSACAQTSAQVYGVLDMWAGRSAFSGAGPATTAVNSGGIQTSYWGFGGSEELGRGAKAIYAVEGYFQLDTGTAGRTPTDAMFARNAYVGLQGAAGELKLGRVLNPLFVATAQVNPFGGSIRLGPLLGQIWSAQMGRAVAGDTSWDNVVSYTTPVLAGFKLAVLAGLGETTYGNRTHNANASLNYTGGPLVGWLSVQRVRVGPGLATIGKTEQNTYFTGGSYDFGVLKLYASWDTANTRDPDLKAKTKQAGVSVPAGAGSLLLSWARTDLTAPSVADRKRDTGAVGYDYALSKRSELYAIAHVDKASGAERAKTYALGMRHRF